MSSSERQPARGGGGRAATYAPLLAALVALAAWAHVTRLALLGWDSYPMILAHRARSASELFGTLVEELMDGRYPLGHFWRPVSALSFALDEWACGLDPACWHATDVALLAIAAALVALLARRLAGGGAAGGGAAGALVAGLVYALHPVHYEVLPVAPRRAESLAVLFTLLALALRARRGERPSRARDWAVAGACLLAVGAKETGAVAVIAVSVLAFLQGEAAAGPGARAAAALKRSWPALAVLAAFAVARTAILGGLGGSEHTSLAGSPARLAGVLAGDLGAILDPLRGGGSLALALGALALLAGAAWLAGRAGREPGLLRPSPAGLVGLALAWVAALAAITAVSGVERGWYALPFLPPVALLAGATAAWASSAWQRGARAAGALALVPLALIALLVPRSPLVDRAPELVEASRLQREFLARFAEAVRSAPAGATVRLAGLPSERTFARTGGGEREVLMLSPYGLEAWAELRSLGAPVRVETLGRPPARPARPGEVTIVLVP